jgi:putative hydrolase of the HAD superfamily
MDDRAPDADVGNMAKHDRWVLFDGDNTLWHIESLYDRARAELVRYLDASGLAAQAIDTFQRAEDKRLFRTMGYSATRFETSFVNTARRFSVGTTEAQLQHVRSLAQSVFGQPAPIDSDTLKVLSVLKGTHRLALITAGERWVQDRRIAEFQYSNMFDAIRVVELKTADVFRQLVTDLRIAMSVSWVVGDSLRSDAMPALAAGLNAILIANHNWIEVERDEERPQSLRVVDRLGDILPIIAAPALGTLAPASS